MIQKETPIGEIKGYYRSTLIAALTLYSSEVEKTRKKEESIGGETAHLDDKKEIVEAFRICLGASTAESIENTPIGDAIARGESKHKAPTEQIELVDAGKPDVDRFAPSEGIDVTAPNLVETMLELAGFDEATILGMGLAEWSAETRLAVYRWTKAVQLVNIEGSNVTIDQVPPLPDVIPYATLNEDQARLLAPLDRHRLILRDAIDAGAIDWPALLRDLAIPDNTRTDWTPTVERMLEFIAAGPYVVQEDAFGFRIVKPSEETPGEFVGEETRYDRVNALARVFLLNARGLHEQTGEELPPEPPTDNDIAKARKRGGAKKGAAKKRR
jgi:hypothetical protein